MRYVWIVLVVLAVLGVASANRGLWELVPVALADDGGGSD